jgi:hypothetical protein
VPQEAIPPQTAVRVTDEMLSALEAALGPGAKLPKPLFTR